MLKYRRNKKMKINCRDCGKNPHDFSDFEIRNYKEMFGKPLEFICKKCYKKLNKKRPKNEKGIL